MKEKTCTKKLKNGLDSLFCTAFNVNHPAMIDWAYIKFELKSLRSQLAEKEAFIDSMKAAADTSRETLAEKDKEIERLNHELNIDKCYHCDGWIDEDNPGQAALRKRAEQAEALCFERGKMVAEAVKAQERAESEFVSLREQIKKVKTLYCSCDDTISKELDVIIAKTLKTEYITTEGDFD